MDRSSIHTAVTFHIRQLGKRKQRSLAFRPDIYQTDFCYLNERGALCDTCRTILTDYN